MIEPTSIVRIATIHSIGSQSQDPEQRGEGRDLHGCGHESGYRSRRTLVDVGGPLVERHSPDLEEQPDEQHAQADEHETALARLGAQRISDGRQVN
jgi:hypothetical protein